MTMQMAQRSKMQCVLYATMPRSGTWYSFFLWENLDNLLTGRDGFRLSTNIHLFHSIGVARRHVHCVFPNFAELAKHPELVAKYDELEFHTQSFNAPHDVDQYTFKGSPDLRIVYIHRNPLDQIVSFHDHSLNHKDRTLLIPPAKFDSSRPYESASDLAMRGGAESYLKQYLTYRYFAELGFPQLKMVFYEDLKRHPEQVFDSILEFCGARLHPATRPFAVAKAVELSSPDHIAWLEKKKGGAIGSDQIGENQSHIRGGEIGKWRIRLSQEAIDHVWTLFAKYGISDTDFQLD